MLCVPCRIRSRVYSFFKYIMLPQTECVCEENTGQVVDFCRCGMGQRLFPLYA